MSLAFLAKKSWHTASIANQERVWKAEQEQEREKKKVELLRKQMMEEKEMDELRKMQGKDVSKEKLAWMYAPVAGQAADADEYLMGKPKEADKEDDELKKVVTSQSVGSNFMNKEKDEGRAYRDDMNKIREDPLLAIKQQEKRARERLLDNPLKIADFKKDLEEKRKRKEEKKAHKAEKKAAKKAKKASKGGGRDSDDGGRSRSPERTRAAVPSEFLRKEVAAVKREPEGRGGSRDGGRDRSRDRDYRRSPPRRRDSRSPPRRHSPPRRRDSRSPPRRHHDRSPPRRRESPPRRRNSRSPPRRRDSPPRRRGDSPPRRRDSRSPPRKRERGDEEGGLPPVKRERHGSEERGGKEQPPQPERKFAPGLSAPKQPYGLWKPEGVPDKDDKGEKGKVVVVERAVRDGRREGILDNGKEAAAAYKAGQRPKLTAEEKAKRLAEMQNDAARNEDRRLKKIKELQAKEDADKDKEEITKRSKADEEAFLSKMNAETFMASQSTMESRLSQTKHYRQRGHELE